MKTKNLLFLGGGALLLYYLFKKGSTGKNVNIPKQKTVTITPDITPVIQPQGFNITPPQTTVTITPDIAPVIQPQGINIPTGIPFTGQPPVIKPLIIPKGNLQTPSLAPVSQYTNAVNGSKVISQQDWLNALSSEENLQAFLTNVKPLKVVNDASNTVSKIYTIDKYSWIKISFQNKNHGYPSYFEYVSLPYPQFVTMNTDPSRFWYGSYLGSLTDLPYTAQGTSLIPGTKHI